MIPPPTHLEPDIQKGDLVRLKKGEYIGKSDPWTRENVTGIVLRFDLHHPDDSALVIRVVEVLWDDGPAWVEVTKLEKCDK